MGGFGWIRYKRQLFWFVSISFVVEEIHKKAALESDITSRIIKENSGIFNEFLLPSFNDAINKSYFPTALKQANITHAFKKTHKKT